MFRRVYEYGGCTRMGGVGMARRGKCRALSKGGKVEMVRWRKGVSGRKVGGGCLSFPGELGPVPASYREGRCGQRTIVDQAGGKAPTRSQGTEVGRVVVAKSRSVDRDIFGLAPVWNREWADCEGRCIYLRTFGGSGRTRMDGVGCSDSCYLRP